MKTATQSKTRFFKTMVNIALTRQQNTNTTITYFDASGKVVESDDECRYFVKNGVVYDDKEPVSSKKEKYSDNLR